MLSTSVSWVLRASQGVPDLCWVSPTLLSRWGPFLHRAGPLVSTLLRVPRVAPASLCSGPDLWVCNPQTRPSSPKIPSQTLPTRWSPGLYTRGPVPHQLPFLKPFLLPGPGGKNSFPPERGTHYGRQPFLSSGGFCLGWRLRAGGAFAGFQNWRTRHPPPKSLTSALMGAGSSGSSSSSSREDFCSPFLSPQGTPVAGSELAQLSAKCCHPK